MLLDRAMSAERRVVEANTKLDTLIREFGDMKRVHEARCGIVLTQQGML